MSHFFIISVLTDLFSLILNEDVACVTKLAKRKHVTEFVSNPQLLSVETVRHSVPLICQ